MHEVITFSNSQSSGHLLAQLYNVQASHLVYSNGRKTVHSNNVFLSPTSVNGRTKYYPRAINVEFSGGYGFLGKHEYHEKKADPVQLAEAYGAVLQRAPKPEKNEYQKCLDACHKPERSMLTKENTLCWTSYSKLVYRPSSLAELPDFQSPEGTHKNSATLRFDEFQIGENEYQKVQKDIGDVFRANLEALDNIQGVNFVSELDNAWGGFTSELMTDVKDEYFNNGANNKHCLWAYGLYSPRATKNLLTEIRSFVELARTATLFLPLVVPETCSFLSASYDHTSPWHRGALQSVLVNSLWGLNSQLELPVRMASIEAELVKGFDCRTIVNEIELLQEKKPGKNDLFGLVQDVNILDFYQTGSKSSKIPASEKAQLGVNQSCSAKQLSSVVIGPQGTENCTFTNNYMQEAAEQDSFPEIFVPAANFGATLKQTTAMRQKLKDYRKVVSRVRLPRQMEVIGDKDELIEEISMLIEEYTVGYSDESDLDE